MTPGARQSALAGSSPGIHEQAAGLARFYLDGPLVTALILLSGVGLVVLYSAGGQDTQLLVRQSVRLAMAFVTMLVVAQIGPQRLLHWTPWLYVAGVLLLLAVLAAGDMGKGAQRWLRIGGFNFQPSELVKVTVPMMVAYYFADRSLPPRLPRLLMAIILVIIPTLLVARQPDLGTALLIGSAGAFVIFLAGIHWRWIGAGIVGIGALTPLVWFFMHDYQKQRIFTFLNPEEDPLGAGYHIIQSKIAIGSGGLYGKGWLNSTQSRLDFLPERSTDFIFSVFCEEFGLLGVLVLMSLYLFIVFRGLYIAANAQDSFGRLLCGGLTLTFFVYVLVNMGMVSGILPVVGLPLPLVSYGGTSMVTMMAAFGILMSVQTHRRLLSD